MAPSKPSPVAKAKRRRKKHAGIPLPKSGFSSSGQLE